eukprot:2149423-Alexandrium_andersonii.AAC.1
MSVSRCICCEVIWRLGGTVDCRRSGCTVLMVGGMRMLSCIGVWSEIGSVSSRKCGVDQCWM